MVVAAVGVPREALQAAPMEVRRAVPRAVPRVVPQAVMAAPIPAALADLPAASADLRRAATADLPVAATALLLAGSVHKAPTGPPQAPPPDLQSQINTWFILSIVSIFGCLLGGIFATVNASQAKSAMAAGNYVKAQSKIGSAKTVAIISLAIGILGIMGRIAMSR